MFDTLLFECVVCRREVRDYPNRDVRDRHLEPICRYCEGEYSETAPKAGAFMDRRIAKRISALANALHCKANVISWGGSLGR